MSCETRIVKGRCGHYQCEYSNETAHGQKCVDIILYGSGKGDIDNALCDFGENCLENCLFSWTSLSKNTVKRKNVFYFDKVPSRWLLSAK